MLMSPFRARLDSEGNTVWPARVVLLALVSATLLGAGVALLFA